MITKQAKIESYKETIRALNLEKGKQYLLLVDNSLDIVRAGEAVDFLGISGALLRVSDLDSLKIADQETIEFIKKNL